MVQKPFEEDHDVDVKPTPVCAHKPRRRGPGGRGGGGGKGSFRLNLSLPCGGATIELLALRRRQVDTPVASRFVVCVRVVSSATFTSVRPALPLCAFEDFFGRLHCLVRSDRLRLSSIGRPKERSCPVGLLSIFLTRSLVIQRLTHTHTLAEGRFGGGDLLL